MNISCSAGTTNEDDWHLVTGCGTSTLLLTIMRTYCFAGSAVQLIILLILAARTGVLRELVAHQADPLRLSKLTVFFSALLYCASGVALGAVELFIEFSLQRRIAQAIVAALGLSILSCGALEIMVLFVHAMPKVQTAALTAVADPLDSALLSGLVRHRLADVLPAAHGEPARVVLGTGDSAGVRVDAEHAVN